VSVGSGLITWLIIGSVLLATLAVVLDRVNFPQKPFRPKRIEVPARGTARDRTGAHIMDEPDDPFETSSSEGGDGP
jgi:hypothetical protein